jgi:hypothetical protein
MSAREAFDRYIRLAAQAHNSFVFLRRLYPALRSRAARPPAGFAPLRRDADLAAARFSAAMLRRSASIKLTTFLADGFAGAGLRGTLHLLLAKNAHKRCAVMMLF